MFNPFGALTAAARGGVQGYTEDAPLIFEQMGMAALGRAFQPDQGPQPPMPGQASMPAAPPQPQGPMRVSTDGAPIGGGPPMGAPPPPQGQQEGGIFGGLGYRPMSMGEPPAQPQPQPAPGASPGAGAPSAGPSPPPFSSGPAGGPPGGMPQLDLQTLAQRIAAKNPNLPPQAMMAALTRATPLLNSQARMELAKLSAQMRQQGLDETARHHRELEGYYQRVPGGNGLSPGAAPARTAQAEPTTEGQGGAGREPPEPQAVGSMTAASLKLQASNYLQTGKLTGFSGRDPVTRAQKDAIKNYAADLAASRGLTPEQVTEMWRFAPRQAGWIMGADGRAAGALGTVVDHLDTAKALFTALNNGQYQLFNQLAQKWAKATGSAAPTNVESAAQIVGAEVMKAVGAAGAGTGEERQAAAKAVGDLAKSPGQAAGTIDTLQKLIAGQLRTKKRQAEAIGLPEERLKTLIGPRAWSVLGSIEGEGGGKTEGAAGFDREAAKKAGYTDKEIDEFLKGK